MYGSGSVMEWDCMSASGPGELQFMEGIMDSTMFCDILEENTMPSTKILGCQDVFQHGNDPKCTSKMTGAF